MFNISYHKTAEVKEKMEELNIEPVWNVAYHCQFNDAVEVSQISSINHSYCIEILGIT